jgi:Zn-dependent protease with chaperone function
MYKTARFLMVLLLATVLASTSMALNIDIGKIIDIGQKAVQATATVPVEREVEIGRGMAASLLGAAPLLQDENLERYVNHIGRWLAAQTERPELTWHFGILDVDTVNAFAAPGGYVFVTRGLMRSAHSEAELAGVLAHEIGHVLRRHHLEAIRNEAMRGIAADLVSEAARQQGFNATPFIQTGMQLYARGLDRNDEYEADRIGVVVATRAGYEPYGLPRVLLTLNDMNPSDANLQLLTSTHPPLAERLLRLDLLMKGKFDSYSQQPQVTERFSEYVHGSKPVTPAGDNPHKDAEQTGPHQEEKQPDKAALVATTDTAIAKTGAEQVAKLSAENRPALEIGHSCTFNLQYKDEGSGGKHDISIYDPKLENGFRSIGNYAQGDYNNPKGCTTVVKALVNNLPNGKPPLVNPAGYDLIWKDENSGSNMNGSVWQPRAPDSDYVCIGSVGQTGYKQPDITGYGCVHKCLVTTDSRRLTPLWTDEGTGATSQVAIYQLPVSQVILALPGRDAPGSISDLNPTGMCQ